MKRNDLIGITGNARHGKNALADLIAPQLDMCPVAFADNLKRACSHIFGIPPHTEHKNAEHPFWKMTPRSIWQLFGSEAMRGTFGENIWVESLYHQTLEPLLAEGVGCIITDVRFPNEAQAVKAWGGMLIKVVRPSEPVDLSHQSEQHIASIQADVTIQNDADLAWLETQALEAIAAWRKKNGGTSQG